MKNDGVYGSFENIRSKDSQLPYRSLSFMTCDGGFIGL
jgi:hypothetical protein